MDWTKAKTILIVALLATNLMLIVNIIGDKAVTKITDDTISETLTILEKNNIKVDCNIPEDYAEKSVLRVSYNENNGTFSLKDNEKNEFKNLKPENIAETCLDNLGIWNSNVFLYDIEVLNEDDISYFVRYKSRIDDVEIYGSYINCTIIDGQVLRIESHWLDPIEYGKKEMEIIPATAALLRFMNINNEKNLDQKEVVVTDLSLVYNVETPLHNTIETREDTAFPFWKIKTADGEEILINAFRQ